MQEPASRAASPKRKIADALPLFTAIASTMVLIGPVLDPKLQLFYRDTSRLYYPVKLYIAERLSHGQLPLWDPWTEAGVSLLGQISPGIFHPFTLLYLVFPFDLAFKLNHLLALPLAAGGAYWLARRLGTAPWPSAVAGVVFSCSGYLVSTAASNLPYALGPASIPSACAALLWLCETFSAKRLLLAGVLLALCNYSGEPQSALLAGAIGGVCALGMAMGGAGVAPRERLRKGLRAASLTALWAVLALAISMPAVLPGGIRAHGSNRWSGLTEEERGLFSLNPTRLLALALPRAFEDITEERPGYRYRSPYFEYLATTERASFADAICLGIPAVLLALFAAFAERRGRSLAMAALVFALAATGTALGIHDLLNKLIPGLGLFRYSEKLLGAVSLLIALGAARGAEMGLAGTKRAAFGLTLLCASTAAVLFSLRLWLGARELPFLEWLVTQGSSHAGPPAVSFLLSFEGSLAMASALALALALVALHRTVSPRRPAISIALACACCFAAALLSDADLLFTCNKELLHTPPKLVAELERRAGPSENSWRFQSTIQTNVVNVAWDDPRFSTNVNMIEALKPQLESLFRIQGVDPYFSLLDDIYRTVLIETPRILYDLFDVRFVYSAHEEMSERQAKDRGFSAFNGQWLEENKPREHAFLVSRVWLAPPQGVEAMFKDPKFDPHRDALALPAERASIGDINASPDDPGSAAMHRSSPEAIEVETLAPARRLLVVAEHIDPGWSATVDGELAPVVNVDAMALGVPVPAGSHLVKLRFWPKGLTAGIWIAGIALLLCLAAIAREIHKSHIAATG